MAVPASLNAVRSDWSPYTAPARSLPAGGRPFSPVPDAPRERLQVEGIRPSDYEIVNHPGRKLDPGKLHAAYKEAEDGRPERQVEIFDDVVERDAHLRDALQTRRDAVARKSWILIPGGDSPADRRAAEMLERALQDCATFGAARAHQLGAVGYGYAYTEIDWRRIDGAVVPAAFIPVWQGRFDFDTKTDEPLLRTRQLMFGERLIGGKWWSTVLPNRKVAMGGLMRTAAYWAMFKGYALRDWLILMDRYGIPYAYAEHDPHLPDDDRRVLRTMLRSLGTGGYAMFQRGVDVHITEAKKTGKADDVHGAMVNLCNRELSKLITGATLAAETQGPGSFALGKEHGARAFDRVLGDAELLADSFRECVALPFVRYNGIAARPPRLVVHVVRDTDPLQRLQQLKMAQELGFSLSRAQVAQEAQLRSPIDEADALAPPVEAEAPDAAGDSAKEGEE